MSWLFFVCKTCIAYIVCITYITCIAFIIAH